MDRHLALGGEFDGVGQQIAQDLANPHHVAVEDAARALGALEAESQPLLFGQAVQGGDGGDQGVVQVEGAGFQRHAPGFDARHVQDVRDQPLQGHARTADQLDHFGLLGRQRRARQGVDDADDPVQRRADLMAHIGQEVGLGAVGGLGRRLGLDQGALGGHLGRHVAGDGVDAVAELLRPPFQGDVAAVLVAIAVDVAQHRIAGAARLDLGHAAQGAGQVVGVDQGQYGQADQLFGPIAQDGGPGGADPHNPPLQVADHQQVQGHVEEGRQIDSGVRRRLRLSRR